MLKFTKKRLARAELAIGRGSLLWSGEGQAALAAARVCGTWASPSPLWAQLYGEGGESSWDEGASSSTLWSCVGSLRNI